MSTAMDRMPGRWSGALDGSNKSGVVAVAGKAIGGLISDTAMTFTVHVGFDPANMVALSVEAAAVTIVAGAWGSGPACAARGALPSMIARW